MPTDSVRAVIYPGSFYDSQTDSIIGSDYVEYSYDQIGEMTSMTDQNGTTHDYTYDGVGRLLSDTVDSTVAGIDYAYKVCGRLLSVTQRELQRDRSQRGLLSVRLERESRRRIRGRHRPDRPRESLGRPLRGLRLRRFRHDRGRHYGQHDRLPARRRLSIRRCPATRRPAARSTYSYSDTSTDDAINRLGSIDDGTESGGTVTPGIELASYAYLGVDTIATENYPEPGIGLDYTGGNDSYSALDQFDRVQEQVWAGYGANSSAGVLDEYTYGYNPAGEVAYRQNVTAGSADLDQAYQYDQMGQLQSLSQGRVNTATDLIMSGTQNFTQSWGLDGMGNWSQFDESGSGVATVTQSRQTNSDNQITGYDNSLGQSTSDWAVPVYDAAGNMIYTPMPGDETVGLTCTVRRLEPAGQCYRQ